MKPPLIRQLTLKNFLSFGPEGVTLDLQPLNVLIGPNASGKSNVLEALAMLRGTPGDLQRVVRQGGGLSEYLWKGPDSEEFAFINSLVESSASLIDHTFALGFSGGRPEVLMERIRHTPTGRLNDRPVYSYMDDGAKIYPRGDQGGIEALAVENLRLDQSILSQRRDPERYPEITFLADRFGSIALFQEWNFGRHASARLPQTTDRPSDFLLPDASNLVLVLHNLTQTSSQREELVAYLRRFYEAARYISTSIEGGPLRLYVEEEGGRRIPASRLSDGTLRYLCLLAILCHPNPPPVIGIEEPELGLHPDIMPTIAELLRKASERTQLFVTTHSDVLVSALSDTPESILVCESTADGTAIQRLDAERLSEWLKEYTLGEIWRMGEIGGNRW